jgi:vacuolar-type H+-ATPase subunit H
MDYGQSVFMKTARPAYLQDMTKLVLNIERVGWSKLEGQRRHDQRTGGDLSHVDLAASVDNFVLHGSGDAKADVQACLDRFEAAPRADNDAPFNRFVIQPGDEFDWSDREAIGSWLGNSKKWLQDEYGDGFVYAVVHVDEKTPHIHAVTVPLYRSKTKHREMWKVSHKQHSATKGKGSYERLRRRCANNLGFDYGEHGNKPRTEAERLSELNAREVVESAEVKADRLVTAARSEAQGIVSNAEAKARKWLVAVAEKTARVSNELKHAARIADLVGMEARAKAARTQKAHIARTLTQQLPKRRGREFEGR